MRTSFLFFLLFFVSKCFSQRVVLNVVFTDTLETENNSIKKNKIVASFLYNYTLKKNAVRDSALMKRWAYFYDSTGNLTQEIKFDSNNVVESTTYYVYNEQNQLVKSILQRGKASPIAGTLFNSEYEYDAAGNVVMEYYYNQDTTGLDIKQKLYDSHNNLYEIRSKINNGNFYTSRKLYYENDQLIKEEALDEKGKWLYSDTYEYDEKNHSKKHFFKNLNGRSLAEQVFFNENNQLVRRKDKLEQVIFIGRPPQFEDLNKVEEFGYNPDGTLSSWTVKVEGKLTQLRKRYYQFP